MLQRCRRSDNLCSPLPLTFYCRWDTLYRLARLLGLEDLVPVSVERRGRDGALTWWIDAKWDESERKAQPVRPPDVAAWSGQLYRMVVFSELIYDTDRNDGNILYTKDWRLWVIDFTRAFRVWHGKTRILAGETDPGKTVLRVAGPALRNGPVYRFDANRDEWSHTVGRIPAKLARGRAPRRSPRERHCRR